MSSPRLEKQSEHDFLSGLGAKRLFPVEEANDTSGRPLQKPRWAGVVGYRRRQYSCDRA